MRREFDRYIVDDVILIAGPEESERLALRQSLRTQLATGKVRAPQAIVQASLSTTSDSQVEQAVHQVASKPEKLYPTASNPPRELDHGKPKRLKKPKNPNEPEQLDELEESDEPDPFADILQTEP